MTTFTQCDSIAIINSASKTYFVIGNTEPLRKS